MTEILVGSLKWNGEHIRANRVILFRGFHPKTNGKKKITISGASISGEWVTGYYFKEKEKTYILTGMKNGIPEMNEVFSFTVGMYTGMTDRDGNRVFEHDVMHTERWVDEETMYPVGECDENNTSEKIYIPAHMFRSDVPVKYNEYAAWDGIDRSRSEEKEVVGTVFDFSGIKAEKNGGDNSEQE